MQGEAREQVLAKRVEGSDSERGQGIEHRLVQPRSLGRAAGVERELVQGWSGVILQAIADLSRNWAPPDIKAPAFKIVSSFPALLEKTLAFLDACKWDEIYKHMDVRFDKLAKDAKSMLKKVGREAPDALAGCYAWLLGNIVVRNTFSPLEGSVPASISERIDKLGTVLWMNGEGYLMCYLEKGFASLRNAEFDELQRWKLDITPEQYEKLKKGKPAAKYTSGQQPEISPGNDSRGKRPKAQHKAPRR